MTMTYCLFNGIKLPVLPTEDTAYSHRIIQKYGYQYRLYLFTSNSVYYENGNAFFGNDGDYKIYTCGSFTTEVALTAWKYSESGSGFSLIANSPITVWTNTDILNSDGTLYLSASSPIPVGTPITDLLSFLIGYLFGCRLRAQRVARKPIGYSYNGVVLPKVQSADGYQYQTIINLDGEYVLVLTEDRFLTYTPGNVAEYRHQWTVIWENGESGIQITTDCLIGRVNGSEWDVSEGSMLGPNCQSVVWTNYDIYERVNNAITDTVHMATSDPVPVYE